MPRGKRFTPTAEEVEDIKRRYLANDTLNSIGLSYGISYQTVRNIAIKAGVSIRPRSACIHNRTLTKSQEEEITTKYISGKSAEELASEYNCSRNTIYNVINRNREGQEARINQRESKNRQTGRTSGPRSRKSFADRMVPELRSEFADSYRSGISLKELGEVYGCSESTARKTLLALQIPLRSPSEAKGGLSSKQEAEVTQRYLQGELASKIAEDFGCNYQTIYAAVRRKGYKLRSVAETNALLFEQQNKLNVEDIRQKYNEGITPKEIAKSYSVSYSAIYSILRRNGIKVFDRQESQIRKAEKDLDVNDICNRHKHGESSNSIAESYPASNDGILNLLKRHGIEIRERGNFGDTIQEILDGTGRHPVDRATSFYIYTTRFKNILKPGIAHLHHERARLSNGVYKECIFEKIYGSRKEAYFIEQAILNETLNQWVHPTGLAEEWEGLSELRRLDISELESIHSY